MKAHVFHSSGEAYDASQTRDNIVDGDILLVPNEDRAAILCEAWPIYAFPADTEPGPGCFDRLLEGVNWLTFKDGRYLASAVVALALHTVENLKSMGFTTLTGDARRLLSVARAHGWEE